ncbi:MAG: VCBS repeat-containing protein [Sphingobacteriales bacterium]|nr:MAG: VCBS repeat-containing protein [Sphingobacteriales bacterium]
MKRKLLFFSLLCCLLAGGTTGQTITSFTPLSAKPGDAVTITGTGFNTTSANNIVFFGATKATLTAATATSITATVPLGATYAPITVLNTTLVRMAYSRVSFTPIYAPAKTSITTTDFLAKVDFFAVNLPASLALGDLDGDGKPDLAVANLDVAKISVFRNTSASGSIAAGSFAANVDFTTGTQPLSVAIGDLDGDGKPDLAVAIGSDRVSVFRNTSTPGSVSFANKVDFTTPRSVAIGDLDGDGKPDLCTANAGSNSVSVLRNTSSSGSITTSSFAAKVDFATGSLPRSVAIGDLDGDGKPDLCTANAGSNSVSVLHNTSTLGSIAASSFAAEVDFTTGTQPESVAIGDLDGDGKPDLAVTNVGTGVNTVSVLRNTSTSGSIAAGSFAAKVDFTTGTTPRSVAIGDLDGDGKPDLAVSNQNSNSVSVLRNTSTSGSISASSFAAKVDFATATQPVSVAIGDLDGDGKPDLAVSNLFSNAVSVLRNADVVNSTITTIGTLTPFTSCAGTASSEQSFTVSGSGLTANLTVTAPTGFEVSLLSGSGFGSSVSIMPTDGTVSSTTIRVRMAATATGTPSVNIACASMGATTKNVAASGTVNAATRNVTNNITSGTVIIPAITITATNQVSNANVTYTASQSVTLLSGFKAEGTVFKAQIGAGCN